VRSPGTPIARRLSDRRRPYPAFLSSDRARPLTHAVQAAPCIPEVPVGDARAPRRLPALLLMDQTCKRDPEKDRKRADASGRARPTPSDYRRCTWAAQDRVTACTRRAAPSRVAPSAVEGPPLPARRGSYCGRLGAPILTGCEPSVWIHPSRRGRSVGCGRAPRRGSRGQRFEQRLAVAVGAGLNGVADQAADLSGFLVAGRLGGRVLQRPSEFGSALPQLIGPEAQSAYAFAAARLSGSVPASNASR
jgi:hypothetical protein